MDNLPPALRQYQLPTQKGGSRRHVTHIVHDPNLPPSTPPRLETWESAREPIGTGGQGNVYLQTCTTPGPRLGSCRALKVIRCQDDDARRRCLRELQTMIRFIEHSRFFVQILGYYLSKSKRDVCIAMPFYPEGDLDTYLDHHGPLPESQVCEVAGQVLQALNIMHRAGFIHRDIKPRNILIQQHPSNGTGTWWVKLADFGISKAIDTATETAVNIGTYDYMAPELLNRNAKSSEIDYKAADVWAVGVLLFYALTVNKGFLVWRLSAESSKLPGRHEVSQQGLDFILRATEEAPAQRLAWNTLTSHEWVEGYVPHVHNPEDDAPGSAESSSSSATSSTRSSMSDTREIVTLATRLEDTLLSINLQSDAGGLQSGESTSVVNQQPASDQRGLTAESTETTDTTETTETTETIEARIPPKVPARPVINTDDSVTAVNHLDREDHVTDVASEEEKQAVYDACSRGDVEAVKSLVHRGANYESAVESRRNRTPIVGAAAAGHVEVVKYLLELAPPLLESVVHGWTPLCYAVKAGHVELVKTLIELGANVNHSTGHNSDTLTVAARNGHIELVRILLDKVAMLMVFQPDPQGTNGTTATPHRLVGALEGHADVVRLLASWFSKVLILQDINIITYRPNTGITTARLSFPTTVHNFVPFRYIFSSDTFLGDGARVNRKRFRVSRLTEPGKKAGTLQRINVRFPQNDNPLLASGWTRLGPNRSALPGSIFQIPFFNNASGDVTVEQTPQLKVLRGDLVGSPPKVTFHFTQACLITGQSPDPHSEFFQHYEWREMPWAAGDTAGTQNFGLYSLPLWGPRCCEGRADIMEPLGISPPPAEGKQFVVGDGDAGDEVLALLKLVGNVNIESGFQLRFQRQLTPRGSLSVLITALVLWDRYCEGWTTRGYMEWALGLDKPQQA